MPSPKLASIFYRDPERPLEEIQKVDVTKEAARDVEEFYETDSAREVLEQLGHLVEQAPSLGPRFLYIHATFGSGKTHLLKLIGYATGQVEVPKNVPSLLARRFSGFKEFRRSLQEAGHADIFVPVFLNLLNRDATKEPPLPLMLFEAIGERLGYPTDPRWLVEFLMQRERASEAKDFWERVASYEVDGETLLDKCTHDRGRIRLWLARAIPQIASDVGMSWSDADVQAWIEEAVDKVSAQSFGASDLSNRVSWAQELLSTRLECTAELLLGLDEIALFVGDKQGRYTELRQLMQTLIDGPNPLVIGTGQWGLRDVHERFVGPPSDQAWYSQEVKLKGADTEVIVRKRWLQKNSQGSEQVAGLVGKMPSPPPAFPTIGSREEVVESYPLRSSDLKHIREVMQTLLAKDRLTGRDYVQGRALLVLVRALFAKHGWSSKSLGAIVPWHQVFVLLKEETTLIPTWVVDLIGSLKDKPIGRLSRVEAVAKVVYLVNRLTKSTSIQATEDTIVYLLLDKVDADEAQLRSDVRSALAALVEKKYAFAEDKSPGRVYRLLTEEEVTLAERIEERASQIHMPRLRATILEWMQEFSSLLITSDMRREIDIANARAVPLTVYYSVLQALPEPKRHPTAVALRVAAVERNAAAVKEQWLQHNAGPAPHEDVLVVMELPANFENSLRQYLATQDVLRNETQAFREIESDQRARKQELRAELREVLHQSAVFASSAETSRGSFGEVCASLITERVVPSKFPQRRTLQQPLQHMDDAQGLAAFFRDGAKWPLARKDAGTLGVDVHNHALLDEPDAWPTALSRTVRERFGDTLVNGEDLLTLIEEERGVYLGTPLETLAALLLTMATARTIQLRTAGDLIRSPREMGRSLRTKTELQRLSVRFEPPPKEDVERRLRTLYRELTGEETTPEDGRAVAEQLAHWAREAGEELQQVQSFVERTFDGADVRILVAALRKAAEDPSQAGPEQFEAPEIDQQLKTYRRARPFVTGDAQELWAEFVGVRRTFQHDYPSDGTVGRLENATASEVPTTDTLRKMVREAKSHYQHLSRQPGGEDGDEEEPPQPKPEDLKDFTERHGGEEDEATQQRLEALIDELNEKAMNRVVRIDN